MTSELNSAWTLVLSYSYQNASRFSKSLEDDSPVSVDNPNWHHYRMSKTEMENLKTLSTHWRITCSFPKVGVDYVDYLRASFMEFNPLSFNSNHGKCMNVEIINIKNNKCMNCTAYFKQSIKTLHHFKNGCYYGKNAAQTQGNHDYFGNYESPDSSFRCTSGPEETTNMWFGGYV